MVFRPSKHAWVGGPRLLLLLTALVFDAIAQVKFSLPNPIPDPHRMEFKHYDPAAVVKAELAPLVPDFPEYDGHKGRFIIPGFIRIFRRADTVAGFGSLVIGIDLPEYPAMLLSPADPLHGYLNRRLPKPWLAFAEVAGRRFLPEDSDSIAVWDIIGQPATGHWDFRLAEGPIMAFGYFPGPVAHCFMVGKNGTPARPDSTACLDSRSLDKIFWRHPRAYIEVERDPLFAVRLYNGMHAWEAEEKLRGYSEYYEGISLGNPPELSTMSDTLAKHPRDYLSLIGRSRILCEGGHIDSGRRDLEAARALDSSYYLFHWSEAACREKSGEHDLALIRLRLALDHSPLNVDVRREILERIEKLEDGKKRRN